jgi:hypothetical protein
MAHARLGHHAEARHHYGKADLWMRAYQPADSQLMRFREEAAAVLDAAGANVSAKPERQKTPPSVAKQGSRVTEAT